MKHPHGRALYRYLIILDSVGVGGLRETMNLDMILFHPDMIGFGLGTNERNSIQVYLGQINKWILSYISQHSLFVKESNPIPFLKF